MKSTKDPKGDPCAKCPLFPYKASTFTAGAGDVATATLVVVDGSPPQWARAVPRYHENLQRLHKNIYITYAVKCWPGPGPDQRPPAKAVSLCAQLYLEPELAASASSRIVALGPVAIWALGKKKVAVRTVIGRPWVQKEHLILGTYHPSEYDMTGAEIIKTHIRRALRWGAIK